MSKDKVKVWRSQPLYLAIYNILITLSKIAGEKASFEVKEIYEVLKSDVNFKDVDISLSDVLRALVILELNGLVQTYSNGDDVSKLSVVLTTQ